MLKIKASIQSWMAHKYKKRSYKRKFKERTLGRPWKNLKTLVSTIINKKTETKYLDVGSENIQLYHNLTTISAIMVQPHYQGRSRTPSLIFLTHGQTLWRVLPVADALAAKLEIQCICWKYMQQYVSNSSC
jgi:hypothetical protein